MDTRKEKTAIVIDTNILFASILKRGSYTRQVILYVTDILGLDSYTPEKTLEEIDKHLTELSKRKQLNINELRTSIGIILSGVKVIGKAEYSKYYEESKNFVEDPEDADYAALALKLRKEYGNVIILTWNKKDYKYSQLRNLNIIVETPSGIKHTI
jgi:predicted nucleic acid-binding protein